MTNFEDPTDELCCCGHLKSGHADRFAVGHGACLADDCDCMQFTWKRFIYGEYAQGA